MESYGGDERDGKSREQIVEAETQIRESSQRADAQLIALISASNFCISSTVSLLSGCTAAWGCVVNSKQPL